MEASLACRAVLSLVRWAAALRALLFGWLLTSMCMTEKLPLRSRLTPLSLLGTGSRIRPS